MSLNYGDGEMTYISYTASISELTKKGKLVEGAVTMSAITAMITFLNSKFKKEAISVGMKLVIITGSVLGALKTALQDELLGQIIDEDEEITFTLGFECNEIKKHRNGQVITTYSFGLDSAVFSF